MSVGCPTTQSNSVEREESRHISQISLAAKNPHKLQGRIAWRVSAIARPICSGWSSRARTIQSAIRSAERGPTPGICRSCAIKFLIASGYSVLLKARIRFVRRAIPSTEEEAAPACASKIATADHLPPRGLAPSEIRYKLPPNAFLDKEPPRSRRNPGARHVPAWPPPPAKAARRFQDGRANLAHSQNQSDALQLCHSLDQKQA